MNLAPNTTSDPSRAPDWAPRRPRLYTPSLADGLGDRLLTYDHDTASSLELLRFKREFSDSAGFEAAVRERIEAVSRLRHPSIGLLPSVEWLGAEEGLALVSNRTIGRRLSERLQDARGAGYALELIRQLTPALAALQQQSPGIVHGLLTAERIFVTPEGQLVIVEHVLASAIDSLQLPASRLRADFGIAVAEGSDPVGLDCRTDVIQLGLIALSLLAGRRIDPSDYPENAATLLDEFARVDSLASARLRLWLEGALQLSRRPFESAQNALDAFNELSDELEPQQVAAEEALPAFHALAEFAAEETAAATSTEAAPPPPSSVRATNRRLSTARLALVAIGAAVVIAGVFAGRPASAPTAPLPEPRSGRADSPAGPLGTVGPVSPDVRFDTSTTAAQGPLPSAVPPKPTTSDASQTASAAAATPAPPVLRFGGVNVISTIELHVFEAGNLVGSTAGAITLSEGSHTLELVNEPLGYRTRQTVTVKSGQVAALTIAVPNGRISINAVPWADVSIDGNPAGQTPLANLPLAIGQHEIVFRHPQFPEQRQTVVVKFEGLTLVSARFQQ